MLTYLLFLLLLLNQPANTYISNPNKVKIRNNNFREMYQNISQSSSSSTSDTTDREAKRSNAAKAFEPLLASLDHIDRIADENRDRIKAQNQHIRSEINARINAIAESSLIDASSISIELVQIDGYNYLPCYTDGSGIHPQNSSITYFGGGVFFGLNCPQNQKVCMHRNVRTILAAEMAAIAAAIEIAHLVANPSIKRLLFIVDNMQAVKITTIATLNEPDESILEKLTEIQNADPAIQHSIKKILSHKGNWLCIKVKHVNSHTGQMDSHSRGNQHADDLATAACRDNFALSPAVDHDLLG